MKTITLSEEAYQRLKSWKTDSSESFSKVVLKAVPKRGTAEDMDEAFDQLPKLTGHQAEAIEAEAGWANDWRSCPDPLATPSVNESAP
jgi:predicted CopG family antitoxin